MIMRPFLTLHNPADSTRYYQQELWCKDTFYGLLSKHAVERPDGIALQDGRRAVSWSQLLPWVDGVANSLREFGLVGGDRVSIWMSNRVCLLYTSPSPRDRTRSRMPSSA